MSPQAHSMFGFPDARAFLNRAIETQNGVRAIFPEWKGAFSFRMRCYAFRKRERALNRKVYEPGQPMFDATAHDGLIFKLEQMGDGRWAVAAYNEECDAIKRMGIDVQDIE